MTLTTQSSAGESWQVLGPECGSPRAPRPGEEQWVNYQSWNNLTRCHISSDCPDNGLDQSKWEYMGFGIWENKDGEENEGQELAAKHSLARDIQVGVSLAF